MFGSVTLLARRLAPPGVPGVVTTARVVGLLVIVATIAASSDPPGLAGQRLALTISLVISAAAWIMWLFTGDGLALPALIAMGVAGGVVAAISPASGAVAFGSVAAMSSAAALRPEASIGVTAGAVASFLVSGLTVHLNGKAIIGLSLCILGFWSVGVTRRAYILRAVQAERLLTETRRAASAEADAAALAERTRIARDIHDVLAHSLAAVSVNLEAASGLLGDVSPQSAEVAKALECVNRAATLTRDGLADAKRAVHALREAAPPLSERLAALVADYGADGDTVAEYVVTGTPRQVPVEVGLTVYRTAQEALTNARKHAPGQPVTVTLGFGSAQLSLEVVNELAGRGPAGPLAATGGGYGVAGLRERAAHAGGTLDAGPAGDKWRVCLRIPA